MINLLVARFSADKCEAATAVAVLTTTYPLGHIAYGWINQIRPVPPAFQKVCKVKTHPQAQKMVT